MTASDATVVSQRPAGGKPLNSGDKGTFSPTKKSKALRAQVVTLIPELAQTPGGRLFDMEEVGGPDDGTVHAGSDWRWPAQANQVTVDVVVGRRGHVSPVCDGATGSTPCTEVRRLPNGSTAYLHAFTVFGGTGHGYSVRLDRSDGISVTVDSAAQKPKDATHDAPLSLERVLEIAQKITCNPEPAAANSASGTTSCLQPNSAVRTSSASGPGLSVVVRERVTWRVASVEW